MHKKVLEKIIYFIEIVLLLIAVILFAGDMKIFWNALWKAVSLVILTYFIILFVKIYIAENKIKKLCKERDRIIIEIRNRTIPLIF